MKINLTSSNPALESIFNNPNQLITLDANILIPPYRRVAKISFNFKKYKNIWLDPLFNTFSNLAIHEAVYDELVSPYLKKYITRKINEKPSQLKLHKDSSLNENEKILRNAIEEKIYSYTKYDPLIDNKDDRGEVKSLAYIAVKGLIYFASHDSNTIQLIEKAEEWSTSLDSVQAVKMYELIFYLYKTNISNKKNLRMLYKYLYYLTYKEKNENPNWGNYVKSMDKLYADY